jgi:hypothetical protein
MRIDLASSALTNSELEETVELFNPKPPSEGWGFSSVFEEMLSREPRKVPVEDLATLQKNLAQAGYLPPDHPADGTWGPDSASAFSQFDRDNGDQVRQGNSLMAGTVQDGVRFLGSMLPRSVIQGVIGTAKGLVEQSGETFERGGALGGAVMGAGLGTAVAPGVGTLIGAIGGGIAGFLTSLADNDDEDGNGNSGILDALHPFNEGEWTTARNFFEDAGFVASAASLVRGVGITAGGVRALGPSALRGRLATLDPVTKPGFVMNALGSAKGSAVLGGFAGGAHQLAVGDDFGDVLEGIVAGGTAGFAVGSLPVGAKLRDLAAKYGLKRLQTNPVVKAVNETFTGGVVANVGGRYAGGWGSGEHDTAIERNIREAPTVLPEWADVVGGMVLLPNRLTPLGVGEIGQAARKFMGDTSLRPFYSALETVRDATGKLRSKKEVRQIVDNLEAEQVIWYREQYGLQKLKNWVLEGSRGETPEEIAMWRASPAREGENVKALNAVMDWYRASDVADEAARTAAQAKNKDLVMALSVEDELDFTNYVTRLEYQGSGVTKWDQYAPAQEHAERLAAAVKTGDLQASYAGAPPVTQVADEAASLSEGGVKTLAKNVNYTAADPRYMTQKDWTDAADEYVRLRESVSRAWKQVDSLGQDVERASQVPAARAAAQAASDELDAFVRTFRDPNNNHRYLEQSVIDAALEGRMVGKGKDKTYAFADDLRERGKHAGVDVSFDDPTITQAITENGYKLVATGENFRWLSEVREIAKGHDIGDYTKRASFFEAAGMSPFAVTEREIGRLKEAHMHGNLNQAANELGIGMNGRDITKALVNKMHDVNNKGHRWGPFITRPGDESIVGRTSLLKVDLRQLTLDQISDALQLDSGILTRVDDPLRAAQVVKDYVHRGTSFGSEVLLGPRHWADDVRMLGGAMRIEGLTGFSDFMRQFHITNPARALTVAGGVAGAGIGAQEEGLEGAIKGGIAGALTLGTVAYGGRAALKKWPNKSPFQPNTYGWLPNHLHNASMALRYSLSFTFDLGRRMEQAQVASMRHGLPVILAPKSWAKRHLADDFAGDPDAVMTGLRAQLDEVMGSSSAMNADDMDRRAAAVGLTGFSQRDADAVYAHLLIKRRDMGQQQIRDAVYELGHYGARTGFERSLNFVIFPFSFSKKMLTTLGDFMLAEPARALLVHEGMRQWYETREGGSMSEKWGEYSEKYLPLAKELARLNNLSYGISPGRFFLEGMLDNKTLMGKISGSLAAVFTPSGAVTPLQQAAGKAGDQLVHLFSPVLLTGEDSENFIEIFEDFAPAVRDVRNLFIGHGTNQPSVFSQQVTAATERDPIAQGGGGAPWYQLRAYNNERRKIKGEYADLANSFGYSTVDGFLNSDIGASYRAEVEARTLALADKYPTGMLKSTHIETSTAIDDKAKAELLADPNRTPGEEMIAQIIEMEAEAAAMADTLGIPASDIMPGLTSDIRQIATSFADDRRFRELYDRFFEYRHGPLVEVFVG